MDETHDKKEIRCRRLGHATPFRYCRSEGLEGEPCRLLVDCWWEQFDVRAFIRANYAEEEAKRLEVTQPPPNKVLSLVEMIEQAKRRLDEKK